MAARSASTCKTCLLLWPPACPTAPTHSCQSPAVPRTAVCTQQFAHVVRTEFPGPHAGRQDRPPTLCLCSSCEWLCLSKVSCCTPTHRTLSPRQCPAVGTVSLWLWLMHVTPSPKSSSPTASYLAGIAMEDLWCCTIGAAPRCAFYLGLLRQQSTKLSTAQHPPSGLGFSSMPLRAGYVCQLGSTPQLAVVTSSMRGRVSCDLSLAVPATHGLQDAAGELYLLAAAAVLLLPAGHLWFLAAT